MLYVDTSAAVKLLRHERETESLAAHLTAELERGTHLVSSQLMETELRRVGFRLSLPESAVEEVVGLFDLFELSDLVLRSAGRIKHHLGTLDAIHLSTAMAFESEITRLLSYDQQMCAAADQLGFSSYQV